MFTWRVKLQQPGTKPQLENKNEKQKRSSKRSDSKSAKEVDSNCKEMVDQRVIKILTKSKGKRSTPKREKQSKNDGWRGPRENPSEILQRRKILKKEPEVFCDLFKIIHSKTVLSLIMPKM